MEFKKFAKEARQKKVEDASKFENLTEAFQIFSNKLQEKSNLDEYVDNKDSEIKYLGEHHSAPNPLEQPINTFYRNINEGVVYIKRDQLWEVFLKDGKNGSQGPQGQAGGSGAGVREVQTLIDNAVSQLVISGGTLNSIEWNKITNIPVASSATSGVLSSEDWSSFNNKVNAVSGNYLPISGGNVTGNLSANNISANSFYFNSTSDKLLSLDSNKKIVSTSISTSSLNYISAVSADVQSQINFINNAINVSSGTGFIPSYVNSSPSVSSLQISAGMSSRIALPVGETIRLTWDGFGPFAYRQGNSVVVANANDSPGRVDNQFIVPVIGTHIAVYGIGSGAVTIEGGYGGLISTIDSTIQGEYLPLSGGTVSGTINSDIISATSLSAITIKPENFMFASNPISYGNKAVLIGDSYHAYYGNVSGGSQLTNNYFTFFQFYNGQRYSIVKNLAVGGKRSDQIITEQLVQSLSYKPDVIFTVFGINDIIQGYQTSALLANTKTIFDTILGSGIRCVYVIPPAPYNCTKNEGEKYLQLRRYVYSYKNKYRGLQIFDAYELSIDSTSTSARSVSGILDPVHPYPVIGKVWGKAFAEYDANTSTGYHIISQIDITSEDSGSKNISLNPLCQGSVSASNAGMTGFLPTGFGLFRTGGTGTQTASASIISRVDGIGNDLQIKFTSNSATDAFVIQFPSMDVSAAKPGQKYVNDYNFTVSGTSALTRMHNNFTIYINGVANTTTTFSSTTDTAATFGQTSASGWVRSNYIEIPTNTSATNSSNVVYAVFDGPGTATFKFGRISVFDISEDIS